MGAGVATATFGRSGAGIAGATVTAWGTGPTGVAGAADCGVTGDSDGTLAATGATGAGTGAAMGVGTGDGAGLGSRFAPGLRTDSISDAVRVRRGSACAASTAATAGAVTVNGRRLCGLLGVKETTLQPRR